MPLKDLVLAVVQVKTSRRLVQCLFMGVLMLEAVKLAGPGFYYLGATYNDIEREAPLRWTGFGLIISLILIAIGLKFGLVGLVKPEQVFSIAETFKLAGLFVLLLEDFSMYCLTTKDLAGCVSSPSYRREDFVCPYRADWYADYIDDCTQTQADIICDCPEQLPFLLWAFLILFETVVMVLGFLFSGSFGELLSTFHISDAFVMTIYCFANGLLGVGWSLFFVLEAKNQRLGVSVHVRGMIIVLVYVVEMLIVAILWNDAVAKERAGANVPVRHVELAERATPTPEPAAASSSSKGTIARRRIDSASDILQQFKAQDSELASAIHKLDESPSEVGSLIKIMLDQLDSQRTALLRDMRMNEG